MSKLPSFIFHILRDKTVSGKDTAVSLIICDEPQKRILSKKMIK
jgi:hypothetical protein